MSSQAELMPNKTPAPWTCTTCLTLNQPYKTTYIISQNEGTGQTMKTPQTELASPHTCIECVALREDHVGEEGECRRCKIIKAADPYGAVETQVEVDE
jgi:hypothetical protein